MELHPPRIKATQLNCVSILEWTPAPTAIATSMYYTGFDPFTGEEVHVSRNLRDRKMQRALLRFFKPENDFEVRAAPVTRRPLAAIRGKTALGLLMSAREGYNNLYEYHQPARPGTGPRRAP